MMKRPPLNVVWPVWIFVSLIIGVTTCMPAGEPLYIAIPVGLLLGLILGCWTLTAVLLIPMLWSLLTS